MKAGKSILKLVKLEKLVAECYKMQDGLALCVVVSSVVQTHTKVVGLKII